jgi:hypothetical protein
MTWLWGALAALALLWPDRISGPIDGVPLDRAFEAVVVGAIFPMLWVLHPRFLLTSFARACLFALLLWKIGASALFVQDGWCVRFTPERPYVKDGTGAPHAWDLRADWRAADPVCSAVMTRSYRDLFEFPAWFFNLPPPNDSWPEPEDRPPGARVGMSVRGFLYARDAGVLRIETRGDEAASMQVDGRPFSAETRLEAGLHIVAMDAVMTGEDWRLVPLWNGQDLWSGVITTIGYPSRFNLLVRPWIRWIPLTIVFAFLAMWIASAIRRIGSVPVLAWAAGASLVMAWLVLSYSMEAARWAVAALSVAILVPVPPRLRNMSGALVMIGIPWVVFIVATCAYAAGRWVLYTSGDDWWAYQRFAYRIVMQGYWLEGGSQTFYFQPFYRWIVGFLHMAFGESNVGEWFWDSACLLAGSLVSFQIARSYAGFRWGLAAAVTPLAVMVLGKGWDLIGRGLGEISSAGLVHVAALLVIQSRCRRKGAVPLFSKKGYGPFSGIALAVLAGVLASAAFYTRLNNLIIAGGVALFALSLHVPVRAIVRPRRWLFRISWRTAFAFAATLALGILFFAWRTWYYTGVFSVFHGTQRNVVSVLVWQPGASIGAGLQRLAHSVMFVLTINDPPRFDVLALPVMAGAAVAVLSIAGVPRLRTLPLAAVLFFFAAIAGAFFAFGWAYTGRFSVHIMPITGALAISGVASLFRGDRVQFLPVNAETSPPTQ